MITGRTCLVGLLGQPVNHSLSPVIQNAALQEMGLDWCYLAMPCKSENLSVITKALRELNCKGLNITIPHKQNILNICNEISPLAKTLGAVNTLIPNESGGWTGKNTDVEGFLAPINDKKWTGAKAIVLGCGGSARAVIAGLQSLSLCQITIVGRRKDALQSFIKELTKKTFANKKNPTFFKGLLQSNKEIIEEIRQASLIVNATPIGMSASRTSAALTQEIPLEKKIWQHLQPNTTLYDLIYTPRPTAWLTLGAKNDCEQIDGLEMLIQQGAASLKLWSKSDQVPIEVMRAAAKEHLKA